MNRQKLPIESRLDSVSMEIEALWFKTRRTLYYTLSHELGSEQSERVSKQMSAEERTSKASSMEQANE